MRFHLILLSTLICATGAMQSLHGQQAKTADEVIATMLARDAMRERASGGYSGDREYILENHLFQKRAAMLVRLNCERDGTKHFEVLSEDGWKSANRRVLREMLATESDSSHPDTRTMSRLTSDNYTFRLIEAGSLEGRTAYVSDKTSPYFVAGSGWMRKTMRFLVWRGSRQRIRRSGRGRCILCSSTGRTGLIGSQQ